jgi:hydroxymethylglutaryl-CoA synthase
MDELGYGTEDFAHVVFHQPNARFPTQAARQLGFRPEQHEVGLLSPMIGNAYAGSSLLGFSAVLDVAHPGDRVLIVSYGSGAGSDAFVWMMTEELLRRQTLALRTQDYIARRYPISYGTYVRYRKKLYAH